jgi:choline dehydrogenase
LCGIPANYDKWRELGNSEWGLESVQPIFCAIERDFDFDNEHHGTSGPTLLCRHKISELIPTQRAFYDACKDFGLPIVEDHNHPSSTGVGIGPWNLSHDGVRISTAIAYLNPALARTNLVICPDTLVDRIIFEGNRATGIEVITGGIRERILDGRVILSSGSMGTPAILLRSGVGTPKDLEKLRIECHINLKGIGRNLVDHSSVGINWESPHGLLEETSPFA